MEDQYVDSDTQSFGARPPGGDHSQCTARSSHVTRLRRGRTRPSQLPTAGRPGRRCGCVHLRRTSSRSSAEASVALRPVHVPETRTGHSKTRTGSETLAALQAIREALAGLVTGAAGLDVARRALRRVFESFTLHRYGPGDPRRRPCRRRLVHRADCPRRCDPLAARDWARRKTQRVTTDQPLRCSASSRCGVSARFCLQIGMILRLNGVLAPHTLVHHERGRYCSRRPSERPRRTAGLRSFHSIVRRREVRAGKARPSYFGRAHQP
jgi:hypothetical protein